MSSHLITMQTHRTHPSKMLHTKRLNIKNGNIRKGLTFLLIKAMKTIKKNRQQGLEMRERSVRGGKVQAWHAMGLVRMGVRVSGYTLR